MSYTSTAPFNIKPKTTTIDIPAGGDPQKRFREVTLAPNMYRVVKAQRPTDHKEFKHLIVFEGMHELIQQAEASLVETHNPARLVFRPLKVHYDEARKYGLINCSAGALLPVYMYVKLENESTPLKDSHTTPITLRVIWWDDGINRGCSIVGIQNPSPEGAPVKEAGISSWHMTGLL
jgi:hypothetical protein